MAEEKKKTVRSVDLACCSTISGQVEKYILQYVCYTLCAVTPVLMQYGPPGHKVLLGWVCIELYFCFVFWEGEGG